jgi:hypothetical protein
MHLLNKSFVFLALISLRTSSNIFLNAYCLGKHLLITVMRSMNRTFEQKLSISSKSPLFICIVTHCTCDLFIRFITITYTFTPCIPPMGSYNSTLIQKLVLKSV